MLTKFRTASHVKLVAVSLVGLMLLTSCGGGEEDKTNGGRMDGPIGPTNRVTLSLSQLTQDTSQGKAIIVDYQGPAFDEDDLRVSVDDDTPVESVFVDDQIHLILPLTELGRTSLAFDFGGFASSLSLNITAAPAIADPPAYVASVVEELVAELHALPEGDWGNEIEALYTAEQELSNLSTAEIRELAIVLKQNIEPLLRQLNSPVVAQFSAAACGDAMLNFVGGVVWTNWQGSLRLALGAMVAVKFAAYATVVATIGVVTGLAAVAVGAAELRDITNNVITDCLVSVVGVFVGGAANVLDAPAMAGVRVAQDDPETISKIHFDEGQARAIILSLNRTFDPEWKSEFVSAMQDVGNLLSKLNNGLGSVVDILPSFFPFSSLARGINSFIGKFDGFISTFAGLENPDRVERANHADLRLAGISDRNITGSITDADSGGLSLEFSFEDSSLVPQAGCADFDFTLSNTHVGLVNVPAKLCALQPEATIMAGPSPVSAGAEAIFRVTFDPALSSDITFRLTTTWHRADGSSPSRTQEHTVSRGTTTFTFRVGTKDNGQAVTVGIESGIGYMVGTPGRAEVRVEKMQDRGDDDKDDTPDDDTPADPDYLLCAAYVPVNDEGSIYTFDDDDWQTNTLPGGGAGGTFYFTGLYTYTVIGGGSLPVAAGPYCSVCRAGEVSVATPEGFLTVGCSEYRDTINEAWEDMYQTPIKTIRIPCNIPTENIRTMCSGL